MNTKRTDKPCELAVKTDSVWHHCPKCGKSHHIFTNPPSWKNMQAICGQWYNQKGFAILD